MADRHTLEMDLDADSRTNPEIDAGDNKTKVQIEYPSWLRKFSKKIIGTMESVFYRLGLKVAQNPYSTIAICLFICGICGIGLNKFKQTTDDAKLWVPKSAPVLPNKKWVDENFPEETRFVSFIISAPNVLSPAVINEMYKFYVKAKEFGGLGSNLDSLCVKIGDHCLVNSMLELWSFDENKIRSLNFKQILTTIQSNISHSPMYGTEFNIEYILGGIRYDENGNIHGATSVSMLWVLEKREVNEEAALAWEKAMIDMANSPTPYLYKTYVYATRTFDDEGYGAVNADTSLLTAGFIIVFIFIIVVLGRFNLVEHKFYVSLAGIMNIGLAIIFCYGLAMAFGFIYGPIHSLMPFLLLGIGVDDMFVIVESLRNLKAEEKKLPLEEKIALSLRHAGVSITVTSITDIVAFGIGGTTVIPALRAFCVYAALGILGLYLLVSTFFVAVLTLDCRRVEQTRDGLFCFVIYKNYKPNVCSQRNIVATIIEKFYAPALMKTICKVLVILVTLGVAGLNLWSFTQLRQDFDLYNYLPMNSYATEYVHAQKRLYSKRGYDAAIYCDKMDYFENREKLYHMAAEVNKNPYVERGSAKVWYLAFDNYLKSTNSSYVIYHLGQNKQIRSSDQYYQMLIYFLQQREGMFYGKYVKFTDTLPSRVKASYIPFFHVRQTSSAGDIQAMDSIRNVIDNIQFNRGHCFSYGVKYLNNETNKVLKGELYQNLALAAGCVFVVTLILIANLWTSLIVFSCVFFTVVDVVGTLQFWGVTIDTASSILIILCVGLAVDYSAHVGHTFMTISGKKEERAKKTLSTIGPAVLNGGFSTFLAFVLLANSQSFGFVMFFRVFMSVVFFGLFHGLVYLPVILSLVGPKPYDSSIKQTEHTQESVEMLPKPKHDHHNGDLNISKVGYDMSRTTASTSTMSSPMNKLQGHQKHLYEQIDGAYLRADIHCHNSIGKVSCVEEAESSLNSSKNSPGTSILTYESTCNICDKPCSFCTLYVAHTEIQKVLNDGNQGTQDHLYCVCGTHRQTFCSHLHDERSQQ